MINKISIQLAIDILCSLLDVLFKFYEKKPQTFGRYIDFLHDDLLPCLETLKNEI
nr:hypothetical protein TLHOJNLA_TLHOJNLA_CDS_0004 [Microvirus sp.]